MSNPNVSTPGYGAFTDATQLISPSFSFNCNGRIAGITISMHGTSDIRGYLPVLQVWRPRSSDSNVYSEIAQIQVNNFGTHITNTHYIYNASLNGSDQVEFQSGDVIGYYHPLHSIRKVRMDSNPNYTLYYKGNVNYAVGTINISSEEYIKVAFQPLISVMTSEYIYS